MLEKNNLMTSQIPYNKQYIDKVDIKAVVTALKNQIDHSGISCQKI